MRGTRPDWLLGEAATVDSVDAVILALSGEDGPYLPTGQGSSLCRGGRPAQTVRPLDLSGMNRILDHAPGDLTVRVEAGVGLEELETMLASRNQWLPPGSFTGGPATVGGLIGSDWRAPLCAGNGSVRDYLIGVSFADGKGRLARAGGQVVKNVAGYDLMKMLIGSLGELGVVVEAVFRLMPRPECWRGLVLECPDPDILARTLEVTHTWLPAGLWRGDLGEGEKLWVVFGGSPPRVRSQVNSARALWGAGSSVLEQEETLGLLTGMTAFCRPGDRKGWGGALPSFLYRWTPGPDVRWLADLLGGHLWTWWDDTGGLAGVPALREALQTGEGHLHLDSLDPVGGVETWGRTPGGESVFRKRLQDLLDPDQRLVRGRLPGGV